MIEKKEDTIRSESFYPDSNYSLIKKKFKFKLNNRMINFDVFFYLRQIATIEIS